MNGLRYRTRTTTSSQHHVAPLTQAGAQHIFESVATNACKRDTVRGGMVATGVATPPDERRL